MDWPSQSHSIPLASTMSNTPNRKIQDINNKKTRARLFKKTATLIVICLSSMLSLRLIGPESTSALKNVNKDGNCLSYRLTRALIGPESTSVLKNVNKDGYCLSYQLTRALIGPEPVNTHRSVNKEGDSCQKSVSFSSHKQTKRGHGVYQIKLRRNIGERPRQNEV